MALPGLEQRSHELRLKLEEAAGAWKDTAAAKQRISMEVYKAQQQDQGQVAEFVMKMPMFLEACKACHVEPTRRLANKTLRKEGIVFQYLLAHPELAMRDPT